MSELRRKEIVAIIAKRGEVKARELVDELGVSVATIRRDLAFLEKRQLIQRTWGGACTRDTLGIGPMWTVYAPTEENVQKVRIAQKAASLVRPGQSVAIENGGTTLAVARALLKVPRIQVITNSLQVAYIMNAYGRCDEVILSGGNMRKDTYLQGPLTDMALQRFRVDICFIGAVSLSATRGITDTDLGRARVKQRFIEIGREVVLAAAGEKVGQEGPVLVEPIDTIDTLVTTGDSDVAQLKKIADTGVKVLVA